MMKRKISILFASLTLFVTACGNADVTSAPSDEPSSDAVILETEDLAVLKTAESGKASADRYEIGDIILADGSAVKAADMTALDAGNIPVAVIAGFEEDGTAFGVGVQRSRTPLQWAADDSAGYATAFTDTVCMQESDRTFSGDEDGSNNWEAICARDTNAAAGAAENYPAFHFVNTYAEACGLTGDHASGWYMPSIAELCEIYQNQDTVDASLQKIYGLDNSASMDGLGINWYWSSSQAGSEDDYAWFVHYLNGYAGECPKNFTNVHVVAVRKF